MKHFCAIGSAFLTAALLSACGGEKGSDPNTQVTVIRPSATTEPAVATATAAPPAMTPNAELTYEGLSTPESVAYDAEQDVYFVSNIEGKPTEADGKAFISKLSPDGKIAVLRFIDGGAEVKGSKAKVELNAPKGISLVGKELWVADIDVVRVFDKATGVPKGKVEIKGATFLNDLTSDDKGNVYVSDSGLKVGANGFEPTGTDAVYKIDKARKVTTLVKGPELNRPNGLAWTKEGIWLAPFNSNELSLLGPKGEKLKSIKLPTGGLDGVLVLPGAARQLVVSSWEGKTIYRISDKDEVTPWVKNINAPADIGWDSKRSKLLAPMFMDNKVVVFP
jgi:hypothetical protein